MRKLLITAFLLITAVVFAQKNESDSLLNALNKHPQEDTVRLKLLNDLAFAFSDVNPVKGLETAEQAIVLAKKLNAMQLLATAYLCKGENYISAGDNKTAVASFKEALAISEQRNFNQTLLNAYQRLGTAYFNMSEYGAAMEMQEKLLMQAKRINDSAAIAKAFVGMGLNYQFMSNLPEALKYQQMALAIFTKINNTQGIADVFTNMGIIYLNLENFNKALEYHKKSLQLNEQTGNKKAMVNTLGNIATAYDNLEDSANAIDYYTKALEISKQINYEFGIASNMGNIGIFHYYHSSYKLAMDIIRKSLPMYKKLNDKSNLSLMYNVMAVCILEAPGKDLLHAGINPGHRFDSAVKFNETAFNMAKSINALRRQWFALVTMKEIYIKQNNYKKALDFYEQAVVLNDSILNNNNTKKITRLEMQYEFNKTQDSIKAVNDKKQALAKAEIQKQHVVKNAVMAGSVFLILAGIGTFIFYKRNRDIKVQKNEAELKAMVTDTEMKALRAQMNPHFIFNSLNSIADYIDKNQTQAASDFASKFARLMRMVLENSEQKEIPLDEDLKALELYMQLERFRLNNKFDYEIIVDDTIDKENTLIPPLILQPFVENSIWHGIAHKEGEGKILVHVQQQNNMLNCIVEDNGIGMQPNENTKKRKSLGMRITRERIEIINKQKNTNASVTVAGKESGVRAEILLPLELSF